MECNTKVADILAELGEIYKSALRDEYRGKQYNQAANALRALNFEVTSTDQCDSIPMLSKQTSKIRKYVGEILSFGKLKALDEMKQRPDVKACLELTSVHGIGPVTAHKLFLQGYKSIADLRKAPKGTLSEPQTIGLKYCEEFKVRIPREEVSVLATAVREAANTFMDDEVHCYCVGSFRRGRSSSGDIDVLVECRDESRMTDLLMHILNDLRPGGKSPRSGILTDDLLVGDVTYMGVARLQRPLNDADTKPPVHRRMDIKVYHSAQLPTALLYFTGSMRFNRSMRLWAKLKGFNLQDKGLYADREQAEMSRVSVTSEEDVFTALGLDYVSPERRNV
jgi:DNA polymerase/3'-5' exonuclease PolX